MKAPPTDNRFLDEEELVGSLILHPDWRDELRGRLRPEDLSDLALRHVFTACLEVQNLTTQTVAEILHKRKVKLPAGYGPASFLEATVDKAAGLSMQSLLAHAASIHVRSVNRRRRELCRQIGAAAENGDDLEKAICSFQSEAAALDGETKRELRIVSASELLGMQIPAREYVLQPILRMKDLAMVFAPRGAGKSWIAQGMAAAVASGGRFLAWEAPKPRRVLLVDGELPYDTIQQRIRINCEAYDLAPGENLQILARDLQEPGSMPNLASLDGQARLERHLDGIEVVFLDNVSTLFRGGIENEAESWESAQEFLLRLRQRGIVGVYVHHAGRSGLPRGTSKREDILDTIISLKRPSDYSATEGARFEVEYTKSRGAYGTDVSPFEARLEVNPQTGLPVWTVRGLEDTTFKRVIELAGDGLSHREIAQEVGRDKSRITRMLGRAKREGRLP